MWHVHTSHTGTILCSCVKNIVIMCDQVTIEEINYNQNIMLDVNFISSA